MASAGRARRRAATTVSPPTPESKTPIGRDAAVKAPRSEVGCHGACFGRRPAEGSRRGAHGVRATSAPSEEGPGEVGCPDSVAGCKSFQRSATRRASGTLRVTVSTRL